MSQNFGNILVRSSLRTTIPQFISLTITPRGHPPDTLFIALFRVWFTSCIDERAKKSDSRH